MDPDLKTAVERLHNCTASFIEDIVVVEKFGKETVRMPTQIGHRL
jgi:hypothetical protein